MNQRNAKQWSLEEVKRYLRFAINGACVSDSRCINKHHGHLGNSGLSSDLGQNRRMSESANIADDLAVIRQGFLRNP